MTIHPEHQKFTLSYNWELREASRPPAPSVELEVDGHTCHLPVNVRVVAVSRIADSAEPQSLPDLTPSPHEVTIHIVCEEEETDLAEKFLRDHQEEARQNSYRTTIPSLVRLMDQLDGLCTAIRTMSFVHEGREIATHLGDNTAHAVMAQIAPRISQIINSYDT